jgi:hypothetical protein
VAQRSVGGGLLSLGHSTSKLLPVPHTTRSKRSVSQFVGASQTFSEYSLQPPTPKSLTGKTLSQGSNMMKDEKLWKRTGHDY